MVCVNEDLDNSRQVKNLKKMKKTSRFERHSSTEPTDIFS